MKDCFDRTIDYLRISVIDKCNLRCCYCQDESYRHLAREQIISYEEIMLLVKHLKKRGLKSVKITGGEPLLRRDLPFLIKELTQIPVDVSLTTNGVLLKDKAQSLWEAGLRRVNIGLDCLDKALFSKITGFNKLENVREGILEAIDIGFKPVKVNVVLIKDLNDDYKSWLEFAMDFPVVVRFVEVMPFVNGYEPVSNHLIKEHLDSFAKLNQIEIKGSGPAVHFSVDSYEGAVGFISPSTDSYCRTCNRLRLNAQGKIRGCLFDNNTFDFLQIARNGCSPGKLDALIDDILNCKPESKDGLKPVENMCQIGG